MGIHCCNMIIWCSITVDVVMQPYSKIKISGQSIITPDTFVSDHMHACHTATPIPYMDVMTIY